MSRVGIAGEWDKLCWFLKHVVGDPDSLDGFNFLTEYNFLAEAYSLSELWDFGSWHQMGRRKKLWKVTQGHGKVGSAYEERFSGMDWWYHVRDR